MGVLCLGIRENFTYRPYKAGLTYISPLVSINSNCGGCPIILNVFLVLHRYFSMVGEILLRIVVFDFKIEDCTIRREIISSFYSFHNYSDAICVTILLVLRPISL